jgi:hypothetical protein
VTENNLQLMNIRDLLGKTFSGDPRTRNSNGTLKYASSQKSETLISPRIEMLYEAPTGKGKNIQDKWSWFRWSWNQTNPPVHESCCYSGLADSGDNCENVFFLVEKFDF